MSEILKRCRFCGDLDVVLHTPRRLSETQFSAVIECLACKVAVQIAGISDPQELLNLWNSNGLTPAQLAADEMLEALELAVEYIEFNAEITTGPVEVSELLTAIKEPLIKARAQ